MFKKIEKLLSLKISYRFLILLFLFFIIFTIFFSGVVRHTVIGGNKFGKFGLFAEEVSKISRDISIIINRGLNKYLNNMTVIPITKNSGSINEKSELRIYNQEKFKGGFLIFSGYSDEHKQNIIFLYDLNKKKYLWKWVPNAAEILKNEPLFETGKEKYQLNIGWNADDINYSTKVFQPRHPLLMKDGSIIFHPGGGAPLVKLSSCSQIEWINYGFFHHSIEKIDETKIIATLTTKINKNNNIGKFFKDDGYAIIDAENGNVLKEESIISILRDNDFEHLVFGRPFANNIIHLNDSQPILESDEFVNEGDIIFSSRHLSTIFLYRPSTNKIIWLRSGPWLAQHDIDYLGNGVFSLFGNNNYLNRPGHKINKNKNSENSSKLYFYDKKNETITTPFEISMNNKKFNRTSSGTQRVVNKNYLFLDIDESLYFMDKNEVIWDFNKYVGKSNQSLFRWSRFFQNHEIDLKWIEKNKCK